MLFRVELLPTLCVSIEFLGFLSERYAYNYDAIDTRVYPSPFSIHTITNLFKMYNNTRVHVSRCKCSTYAFFYMPMR